MSVSDKRKLREEFKDVDIVMMDECLFLVKKYLQKLINALSVGLYKVMTSLCTSFSPFSLPPLFGINSPYLQFIPPYYISLLYIHYHS